ncbi:MAG: sodium:calcium antiporter [Armatimonadota bacterium]|nr:sodium:calcium antiporter [Armatimonadota bacterium]
MTLEIVFALGSLVVILVGCELFTNGIEWVGAKCNLSTGACGSVLAAVGTALPETLVPIVAFIKGGEDAQDIGTGGILGAPFMLATLGFTVTAIGVLAYTRSGRRQSADMAVDAHVLSHDLGYFLVAYLVAVGASFLPTREAKWAVGIVLVGVYVYYVWLHFRTGTSIAEHCEMDPLRITPHHETPRLRYVTLQVAIALGCIFVGAHVFVDHLENVAKYAGISPLVLSIIITPIATELPEKFNSVLWVRDTKDTLAMGNITGAMVFQSTIPVTIGMFATPWILDASGVASAVIALTSGTLVYVYMRSQDKLSPWALLVGLPLYGVFLAVAF